MHKGIETQKHTNPEAQKDKDTKSQRHKNIYRDTKHMNPQAQKDKDAETQRQRY